MFDFILDNLIIIGLIISILCALIEFIQGGKKNKFLFFLITTAASITAFVIASYAANQNKKNVQTLEGFAVGGRENYPVIALNPESDTTEFQIINPSADYNLFDINCEFIQVSARHLIVNDLWLPQTAGHFELLRPNNSEPLRTYLNTDTITKKFPERRYNFYTVCKNGYFKEQMILRLFGHTLACLFQIRKDGKVIYTSPDLDKYRFPGEDKIIFQDEMEGGDKRVTRRVIDSLVKLSKEGSNEKEK